MQSTPIPPSGTAATCDIHAMFAGVGSAAAATHSNSATPLSHLMLAAGASPALADGIAGQANGQTAAITVFANLQETLPDWASHALSDYRARREGNAELALRGSPGGALDDPETYSALQASHTSRTQLELQFLFATCTDAALARVVNDPLFDRNAMRLQALAIIEFRNRHNARQQQDDQTRLASALLSLSRSQVEQLLAVIPAATLAYLADDPSACIGHPAIRCAALSEFLKRRSRIPVCLSDPGTGS